MKTENVSLNVSDGTTMQAYISAPTERDKYPAVIVLQEAFGVNNHIRNVANRLASEGYVAIAPELFHRTAPAGFEGSYTDFTAVAPHVKAVTTEGITADLNAVYAQLQKQSNVNHAKIGSIGFCMGGRVSFIANLVLPLSASVSYYGSGTEALSGRADELHAPHLFFWGGLDTHIPQEKINTITNALNKANKPYTNVVLSYAGHAFNCDEKPSYNKQAASEAWAMMLAFLKNNLAVSPKN